MLSVQQQKVVNINGITAKKTDRGEYVFLIAGKYIRQSPSFTENGAIKKGIGYVMSRYRK